jgi:hypothetical protein
VTGSWGSDELERIAAAEELQLESTRSDGTLRRPVTIWVVRLGDDLYVRGDDVNDEIDAAYRTKYHDQPVAYVDPIVTPEARAATVKLVPRAS